MNKVALIVGSSRAGIQAALDLADAGIKVHLVESSPFLGNQWRTTVPQHLLNTRLLEVAKHPDIQTWTNTSIQPIDDGSGNTSVVLRTHPRYVDLSKCTACGDCIEVCPITIPGTNHKAIYVDGQPGCMAIEKVGLPPCADACPGGIHVGGYVALTAQGRFQEAIDLIRDAIPFPGICGRICTHPCEINCRRTEIDQPVAVRRLKRFLADWELGNTDPLGLNPLIQRPHESQVASEIDHRVAIVGAGPGGMAVADQLVRKGYQVTVFERLPVVGGMMAIGIPEYRLPFSVITREYQHLQGLGVDIRLNTTIGPDGDYTLDDLFDMGYQAVCLAVGAHKSMTLGIPGENMGGVIHGIELLKTINLSQLLGDPVYQSGPERMLPKGIETRVVVLGGGDTAIDVSRSLVRLGLKDVAILYRRTRVEMPARAEEIRDAILEGVRIEYLVSPVRILGDSANRVTGLVCNRMKLGEPDASGRRRPIPIESSEFTVDVDVVVLAIGQALDLGFLGLDDDITITRDDRISVTPGSYTTSRTGVFAVGDAVTRENMVVIEALGMGKKAAAAIDAYLCGQDQNDILEDSFKLPISQREMTEEERVPKPPVPVPTIPLDQRRDSYLEVELCYSEEQAIAEAKRCLACGPCSDCMACVQVCKPGAIVHEQVETRLELDIGVVIYADRPLNTERLPALRGRELVCSDPTDPLSGSAAAGRAMMQLSSGHQPSSYKMDTNLLDSTGRIGVFICECGGEISRVVDTLEICNQASTWPGVIHAQLVSYACSQDTPDGIRKVVNNLNLGGIVLAGCTCCSLDQVCYSCTYQRVRCKENLGIFETPEISSRLEFVNIREQCAWTHQNDPQLATAKAKSLVAASVARIRTTTPSQGVPHPIARTVMILGRGCAASTCGEILKSQGILVNTGENIPDRVQRTQGQYAAILGDRVYMSSALVLTPLSIIEAEQMLSAFNRNGNPTRPESTRVELDPLWPGIYYCDPDIDPEIAGAAAAARITAWLNRAERRMIQISASVDPTRCRACSTCIEICEFGAPELVGEHPSRFTWIDPAICTGCGTCAAHCPSGAIEVGLPNESQLEATLDVIMA